MVSLFTFQQFGVSTLKWKLQYEVNINEYDIINETNTKSNAYIILDLIQRCTKRACFSIEFWLERSKRYKTAKKEFRLFSVNICMTLTNILMRFFLSQWALSVFQIFLLSLKKSNKNSSEEINSSSFWLH